MYFSLKILSSIKKSHKALVAKAGLVKNNFLSLNHAFINHEVESLDGVKKPLKRQFEVIMDNMYL